MKFSWKKILFFNFLLLAVLAVFLLVGPRVPADRLPEFCVQNVDLPGPFGLSINCDSPTFLKAATHPSVLLEYHFNRQSRPGAIWPAYVLSWPFRPLSFLVDAAKPDLTSGRNEERMTEYAAAFAGYALFGVLITLACIILFLSALRREGEEKTAGLAVLLVSSLFVTNEVFSLFFWNPHANYFNLLLPAGMVWAGYEAWRRQLFAKTKKLCAAALLGAWGIMSYGTFMVFPPFILLIGFLKRKEVKNFYRQALIFSAVSVAPMLAWIAFVKATTGSFYVHESSTCGGCGQFVWVFDQPLWQTAGIYLNNLWQYFLLIVRYDWLVVGGALISWFWMRKDLGAEKGLIMVAAAASAFCLLFVALTGRLATPLAFAVAFPWVFVLGAALNRAEEKYRGRIFFLVLILAWLAWLVFYAWDYIYKWRWIRF